MTTIVSPPIRVVPVFGSRTATVAATPTALPAEPLSTSVAPAIETTVNVPATPLIVTSWPGTKPAAAHEAPSVRVTELPARSNVPDTASSELPPPWIVVMPPWLATTPVEASMPGTIVDVTVRRSLPLPRRRLSTSIVVVEASVSITPVSGSTLTTP